MNTERKVQPQFSMRGLGAGLLLLAAIALWDLLLGRIPNREELGWRATRVEFQPLRLDPAAFAPFGLAGAWRLASDDPRFGGISALAVDRGGLLALTDAGALIRFGPPDRAGRALIGELPGGPGTPRFKRNRDSEALARDPLGRGWWVAFENRHQLWLYDPGFGRALQRIHLGERGWHVNRGIEGAAGEGSSLLLVHEKGGHLLRVAGARSRALPIAGARGGVSDIAAIRAGLYLAVERRPTLLGFRTSLVTLERSGAGYRFDRRLALPLGPLDNVEAIAAERRPGGGLRLWLMTDDNFQPPLRTLLIALDWPPARQ